MRVLILAILVLGQCGAGQCQVGSAPDEESRYEWLWIKYDGMEFPVWGYKAKNGKITWDSALIDNIKQYKLAKSKSGDAAVPDKLDNANIAKPGNNEINGAWWSHGVDPTKLTKDPAKYHAQSQTAIDFVKDIQKWDEFGSGKMHVTVIGTEDERNKVINDIAHNKAFDDVRDNLFVQGYDPKDWQVDPLLGFLAGKPAIYVQACKNVQDPKGGRVILRTADYSIGPNGLSEAIRKADPKYKPDKDPSPDRPVPHTKATDFLDNPWLLTGGAIVFILLFIPSKKGS
jgi:hypothetical protein